MWVNTILLHTDTRMIYLGMKVLAWCIDLNGIKLQIPCISLHTLLVLKK